MLRDLQYGFRQLRRNQFFSGVVIVLLALGIGANTLVFSLVNELLLKPLPVRNPQNLFLVEKMREKQVRPDVDFEYRALLDIFQKNPLFPAAVAEEDVVAGAVAALDAGGPVRLVTTQMVSPNYFSELGV